MSLPHYATMFDDPLHPRRLERLDALRVNVTASPQFDGFATELGSAFDTPLAMVNFPRLDEHFFAGLYVAETPLSAAPRPAVARTMPLDYGGCPEVLKRKAALPLRHLHDSPRFTSNPVIDEFGIVSYLGAPIIDPETDLAIGTVCTVDLRRREWTRDDVETTKAIAVRIAGALILPPQR